MGHLLDILVVTLLLEKTGNLVSDNEEEKVRDNEKEIGKLDSKNEKESEN